MSSESKCACQRCGQPIAFPTAMNGQNITCPHCDRETTLQAVRKAEPDPTAPAPPALSERTIACGYAIAALLPLIGFLMGIYFMTKNRTGSGLICIGVSIVCGLIWLTVLSQSMSP